jgi:hypothetical protein
MGSAAVTLRELTSQGRYRLGSMQNLEQLMMRKYF